MTTDLTPNNVWQPVFGYKGQYEVSDQGLIRSLTRRDSRGYLIDGRMMKTILVEGYPQVNLTFQGNQKKFYLHQLVLHAFVGPCPKNKECCHRNGHRNDSRLENLYYGTRKENMGDAIRHGTTRAKGVLRSDGKRFRTVTEAAKASDVSGATVLNSHRGKRVRGFTFEIL